MNEHTITILDGVLPAERILRDDDRLRGYSHDWWPLAVKMRQLGVSEYIPIVAVLPESVEEVVDVVRYAQEHNVALTPRGLGSSVTGAPLPTAGGILLDLSRLVGEPSIDAVNHTVTVPAGVRGDDLEAYVRRSGYTLGHSPQSLDRSSVGGWLATLATGQLSSRYGGIEDLVVGYSIVLADGRLVHLEPRPRAALGTDLRQVFIGSEGTLGVFVEVTLKLFPLPELQINEAFTISDVVAGVAALRDLSQSGLRPAIVRLYDTAEAAHATKNPDIGSPAIFLASEGLASVAKAEHAAAVEILGRHGAASIGPAPVEGWLARRYDFSHVENILTADGGFAETIEVAANWSDIGALYEALTTALRPHADEVLGHFSHIYEQGTSLYVILLGNAETNQAAAERIEEFWRIAMSVTAEQRGELSHHHGAGLARKPYLSLTDDGVASVSRDLKRAFDPRGILNPGKLHD